MPAGDLDRPFGLAGFAAAAFARDGAWGNAVARAPGGALVVAGGAVDGGAQAFAIARFRSNGQPDETFGDGRPDRGCVLVRWPGSGLREARAVAVQPDGRILVAGLVEGTGGFALVRLEPGGRLDRTFGTGGRVVATGVRGEAANAMVLLPDGRVVVAGAGQTRDRFLRFGLVRYLRDGTLDRSFGRTGVVFLTIEVADSRSGAPVCFALARDVTRGRLVAAGRGALPLTRSTFRTVPALARIEESGTLDRTFGDEGRVLVNPAGTSQIAAIAVNANGNVAAAGGTVTGPAFVVWSFEPHHGAPNAFGDGGEMTVSFVDLGFPQAIARGVAIHPSAAGEGIVVVGSASGPEGARFALARLQLRGRLDPGFGRGGRVVTPFFTFPGEARAVIVQPRDRKIVVAGTSTMTEVPHLAVARFLGA